MKYTGHIKTGDYEFIEFCLEPVRVEAPAGSHYFVQPTAEEAIEAYKELQEAYKPQSESSGLHARDFCKFLDCYLGTGKPPEDGLELWESMSSRQRDIVNEVKKCLKRINK